MAMRPIFMPCFDGPQLVVTRHIEFQWHPGMTISQSQKSIASLHGQAQRRLDVDRVLEISSKSSDELGVKLSAFNLMIRTVRYAREFSLECAFQASKVFEQGGPFTDLLSARSVDAKRDPRLKESGRLVGFRFFGVDWDLEPKTAFYDWLYINALHKHRDLADEVLAYRAFSDIAFNPGRSVNCQAYAAALYISLHERGLLDDALLRNKNHYLATISTGAVSNAHEDTSIQTPLL